MEEWGQGKPPLFAMMAQMIAGSAEECYQACLLAREGENIDGLKSLPSLHQWYKLYRNHRRLTEIVPELFLKAEPETGYMESVLSLFQGSQDITNIPIEQIQAEVDKIPKDAWGGISEDAIAQMNSMYEDHLNELRILNRPKGELAAKMQELLKNVPEIQFFFRVAFPCWAEYGKPIAKLLREARQGNINAIEDILRLDRSALEDERIREYYHQAIARQKKAEIKIIEKALSGKPKGSLTILKVKYALAALIFKICAAFDRGVLTICEKSLPNPPFKISPIRLKIPEVRRLFDAVAKDFHNQHRDLDFPEAPNSFQMGLRRELDFWPDF